MRHGHNLKYDDMEDERMAKLTKIREVPNWVAMYRWQCPGCGKNGPLNQTQKEAEDDGKAHVGVCKWKSIMQVGISYLLAWYSKEDARKRTLEMNPQLRTPTQKTLKNYDDY